jgi:hypothetical protein
MSFSGFDDEILSQETTKGTPTLKAREAFGERAAIRAQDRFAKTQAKSRTRAEEVIPNQAFGRVEAGRAPEVKDLIQRQQQAAQQVSGAAQRREQLAANPFGAEGRTALSEELNAGQAQDLATAQQQQAEISARNNVRGPTAAAAQGKLIRQHKALRMQNQNKLFLASIEEQNKQLQAKDELLQSGVGANLATGSLEQAFGAQEQAQQRANQDNARREIAARFQTELGLSGVESAVTSGAQQQATGLVGQIVNEQLQSEANAAAANQGGGGGGKFAICSELAHQGVIPMWLANAESKYLAGTVFKATVTGYHIIGKPYASLMRTSPLAVSLIKPMAMSYMSYIAYIAGNNPKIGWGHYIVGGLMKTIGHPVFYLMGKIKEAI